MNSSIVFGPHNLSDLVSEPKGAKAYYGVNVDAFSASKVEGAEVIGFVAKMDQDSPKQFSFDVMDMMIQYRQAKIKVMLEVPFDFSMKATDVLVIANSIGAGIIVTPPAEKKARNWEQWRDQVKEYAQAMLAMISFDKEVIPVTSYTQYMAMQAMGYTPPSLTDDIMMHHYFESDMDHPTMDALKVDLESMVHEAHGGAEAFDIVVHSTLSAMKSRLDDRVESIRSTYAQLGEKLISGSPESVGEALVSLEIPVNLDKIAALSDTLSKDIDAQEKVNAITQASGEDTLLEEAALTRLALILNK